MRRRTFLGPAVVMLSLGASAVASAAPPGERDQPDLFVSSSGTPAAITTWKSVSLPNAVVILGSAAQAPCALYWWKLQPDGNGGAEWEWQGPLTAAGMPASTNVTSASLRLVSNQVDTVLASEGPQAYRVLKLVAGAWEYRGTIHEPAGQAANVVSLGDDIAATYVTPTNVSSTLRIYARGPDGSWPQTSDPSVEQLGLEQTATSLVLAASSLVSSGRSAQAAAAGKPAIHRCMLEAGVAGAPSVADSPFPALWRIGSRLAASGTWLLADGQALGTSDRFMSWYTLDQDGTMTLAQVNAGLSEKPTAIQGDRALTDQAVWSLGPDQVWRRGAELSSSTTMLASTDCVSVETVGAVPRLSVWKNVIDCDGDGVDDAFAIAQGIVPDCNVNGRPDSCDLADNLLPDVNQNGVPDACELDCDLDGTADLTQIRHGAPASCGSTTTLASCAIATGAPDVNADGIVDTCGPDMDGNGVPDAISIANGSAADCNGDGVPDGYPAYSLHTPAYMPWYAVGNASTVRVVFSTWYASAPGQSVITGITCRIWSPSLYDDSPSPPAACEPVGSTCTAFLASDPNGDGHPDDAEILWQGIAVLQPTEAQCIAVPSVEITSPGFFVGIASRNMLGTYESWCGGIRGTVSFSTASVGEACGRGWLRLLPSAGPLLSSSELTSLTESSMTPDIGAFSVACSIACDFNGDGIVNGTDLGMLLGAWGPSTLPLFDLNQDGSVDGVDLGLFLGSWGNQS
ncbi:MAG: hypothetical protein U0636_10550 [Phycisphaerales bacterium]